MINVAILGYGTVGSGVFEVLNENKESISRRAGQELHVKLQKVPAADMHFSGVRSRVDDADSETPKTFRGVPATLIAAAIVSMSFLGFGGLGQ